MELNCTYGKTRRVEDNVSDLENEGEQSYSSDSGPIVFDSLLMISSYLTGYELKIIFSLAIGAILRMF